MASKRGIVDGNNAKTLLTDKIVILSAGIAYCSRCIVWMYDKATLKGKDCIVIRVGQPNATIEGHGNYVVNYDNIPQPLYNFLLREGALNAVV